MKRILDKIRFMKSFPKQQGYTQYNEYLGAAHQQVGEGDFRLLHLPRQTVFYRPYKGTTEQTGLRITCGSNSTGTYIAIECTARKLTDDEWLEVRGYLAVIFGGPEVLASKFKLFEIELAVDIPEPISEFIYIAPNLRQQNPQALLKGQIEIGSKHGNRWIRVYDKKKQLKQKKGIAISQPLTRIEIVRRRMLIPLTKLQYMANPFGEIVVVPREKLAIIKQNNPTDYVLSHFCGSIAKGATGQSAYVDLQDADMRKNVRKRLEPYALDLVGTKADWDSWITTELAYLKDKFKSDYPGKSSH